MGKYVDFIGLQCGEVFFCGQWGEFYCFGIVEDSGGYGMVGINVDICLVVFFIWLREFGQIIGYVVLQVIFFFDVFQCCCSYCIVGS